MRNRAKCKCCGEVLESFHRHDYLECKCGEIFIDGGTDYFKCGAKNWDNFLRIDDDEKERPVQVVDSNKDKEPETTPDKKSLIEMLVSMSKAVERLPDHAMTQPINHYDWYSLLTLLSAIFKVE